MLLSTSRRNIIGKYGMGRTSELLLFMAFGTLAMAGAYGQTYEHRHFLTPDGVAGSKFGWSIGVGGDLLVVGAPHGGSAQAGRVHVFQGLSFWEAPQGMGHFGDPQLDAPQLRVGATVATNGEVLAVSSCSRSGGIQYCGPDTTLVSLYGWSGGSWQMFKRVLPPEGVMHWPGTFGRSLHMSDARLAVGGGRDASGSGVVCLYHRDAGGADNWGLERVFYATEVGAPSFNAFGRSVALGGDVLLVGEEQDGELGDEAGAVYCFQVTDGGEWSLVRKLLASDGTGGDGFGAVLALDGGSRAVVGSPGAARNGIASGVVHVFDRAAGGIDNWGEAGILLPSQPQAQMAFGAALDAAGNRVAVGMPGEALSSFGTDGSVEVFHQGLGEWPLLQRIVPWQMGLVNEVSRSGTAVRFHGDRLIVGAPWGIMQDGGNALSATGGVLIFADPALGMAAQQRAEQPIVHPVPAVDHVFIHPPEGIGSDWSLEVLDVTGRVVRHATAVVGPAPIRLERAGLSAGPHVLRFTQSGGLRRIHARLIWQ
jgi:hypothetical protein